MHPMTAYYQAELHADELRREAASFRLASLARRGSGRPTRPLRQAAGFTLLELGLRLAAR